MSRLIAHGLAPGDAVSGPYRGPDACARGADVVAVMRALKAQGKSVGRVLRDADVRLGGLPGRLEDLDPARPLLTLAQAVPANWADYNGHMTEARYLDCFGRATDRFMMLVRSLCLFNASTLQKVALVKAVRQVSCFSGSRPHG